MFTYVYDLPFSHCIAQKNENNTYRNIQAYIHENKLH